LDYAEKFDASQEKWCSFVIEFCLFQKAPRGVFLFFIIDLLRCGLAFILN
jgi:hypothetical protein